MVAVPAPRTRMGPVAAAVAIGAVTAVAAIAAVAGEGQRATQEHRIARAAVVSAAAVIADAHLHGRRVRPVMVGAVVHDLRGNRMAEGGAGSGGGRAASAMSKLVA